MARCACAACDMGSSLSMTAATFPASMSGHTWSRTAATTAAFSLAGRARSVVACTLWVVAWELVTVVAVFQL